MKRFRQHEPVTPPRDAGSDDHGRSGTRRPHRFARRTKPPLAAPTPPSARPPAVGVEIALRAVFEEVLARWKVVSADTGESLGEYVRRCALSKEPPPRN